MPETKQELLLAQRFVDSDLDFLIIEEETDVEKDNAPS